MIISASTDYREAARRKLPPFLFHYIDGGAYAEHTLKRNVADSEGIFGALTKTAQPDVFNLRLSAQGYSASFDLRANSVENPFDLTMFSGFACPRGF